MPQSITEAQVQNYKANVMHLSQQKGSKLASKVRNETQHSKADFHDRLGEAEATKKTSRHGDTPLNDIEHSRRRVTLVDYEWATLVDKQDKLRIIQNPESEYAKAAMWAMGRAKDNEILLAASGTAYAGEEGGTSVTLPSSQKIVAVSGGAGSFLNVDTLIKVKSLFGVNEVDEDLEIFMAIDQKQVDGLLAQTQVTSADYASVKALVEGKVDKFMGITFVKTERVKLQDSALAFNVTTGAIDGGGAGNANGYRKCIAWAKDGLLLSTAQDMMVDIAPRRDKSLATQVYVCMSIGATRMEEEKVVEVLCKASA